MTDLFLRLAHDSWIGDASRHITWLFSVCETLHFVGLSLLIGSIFVLDLRLLGFAPKLNIRAALNLIPLAIAGFTLNLATGVVFFCSNPINYWENPAFRLKMGAILLAGLNAGWFAVTEHRKLLAHPEGAATDRQTKATAALSIGFWLLVILLGRLLPVYAGTDG